MMEARIVNGVHERGTIQCEGTLSRATTNCVVARQIGLPGVVDCAAVEDGVRCKPQGLDPTGRRVFAAEQRWQTELAMCSVPDEHSNNERTRSDRGSELPSGRSQSQARPGDRILPSIVARRPRPGSPEAGHKSIGPEAHWIRRLGRSLALLAWRDWRWRISNLRARVTLHHGAA